MNRIIKLSICLIMLLTASLAFAFAPKTGTPTVYKVKFYRIEFGDAAGNFYPAFIDDAGRTVDIAAVSAGGTADSFPVNQVLPSGTYTQMRVTIASNFSMVARTDHGCTDTSLNGVTASDPLGIIAAASVCNVSSSCTPSEEVIVMPTGSGIVYPANVALIEGGTKIRATDPLSRSLTIVSGKPPQSTLTLNVKDTFQTELLPSANGSNAAACLAFQQPPLIEVSV